MKKEWAGTSTGVCVESVTVAQYANPCILLKACVGVILVGPTGGGKTTVRKILEKALITLPVTSALPIKERQSDSKVSIY